MLLSNLRYIYVAFLMLVLAVPNSAMCKDVNIALSIPDSPLPWLVTIVFAILFLITISILFYIIRLSIGKEIKIHDLKKKKIEQSYARKVKAEYKAKSDILDSKIDQVKQRFSTVITKIRNILSTLDPESLFNAVAEILEDEIGTSRYIVFLHDPAKKELYPFRWLGYSDAIKDKIVLPTSHSHLLTYAMEQKQTIYRCKAIEDPAIKRLIDRKPISSTIVAMPIVTANNAYGVVHIESFTDGHTELDENEMKLLSALPTFIGGAIENANIFVQTREELTSAQKISENEIAEKKKLQDIFSRYTSADLVNDLLKNPEKIDLGGSNKEAAILFCDIAGFTNFSSKLTPKQVVIYMNEYLSRMTEVILDLGGEIDKFIGDSIMARFGVLSEMPYPGRRAVDTACAMLKELEKLHEDWLSRGIENFDIRIGIASGTVLAGNIGSSRRLEFTVMGSVVNLASRLETMNKKFKSHILVCENTFLQLPKGIKSLKREQITVRGFDTAITIYEIQEHKAKPKIVSLIGRKNAEIAPTEALDPEQQEPNNNAKT